MKTFLLSISLFLAVSCSGGGSGGSSSSVTANYLNPYGSKIQNISISNDHLLIKGLKLEQVTYVKVKTATQERRLSYELVNGDLRAKLKESLAIAVGETFKILIGNVYGEDSFEAIFNVADNAITTSKIQDRAVNLEKIAGPLGGQGVSLGQVLTWNGSAWAPSAPSASQIYAGSFNANTNIPDLMNLSNPQPGEYYIASVAGIQNFGSGNVSINVGDWVIYNGSSFSVIPNSTAVSSVFGRQGSVVALVNDYTWAQINKTTSSIGDIADVDLTIPPTSGEVLTYNGSEWTPGSITLPANSVTNSQISDGSINISKVNGLPTQLSTLTTSVSGKEPAIAGDSTSKVFRGDKTFVTLDTAIVPENGNLYFTDGRAVSALSSTLSGYATAAALGLKSDKTYVDSQIASVSGNVSALDTDDIPEGSNLYFTNTRAVTALGVTLGNYVTSATHATNLTAKLNTAGGTVSGELALDTVLKLKDSTVNHITVKAPASVTNYSLTLPDNKGANGQALVTDGNGTTTWSSITSAVTSVNAQTGDVVLSSSDVAEGSNLYFTNARAVTALGASLATKEPSLTVSTSDKYYRGDKTFQTLNTDAVAEGSNLYFTTSRAINSLKGADFLGLSTITGIATPIFPSDIANMGYVDSQITSVNGVITSLSTDEISEGSNLYFTDARAVTALGATLGGYATNSSVSTDLAGKLGLSGGTLSGDLSLDTLLKLKDSTVNHITVKAPASVTSYVLTLPGTKGINGQALVTDGNGVTAWSSITSAVTSVNAQTGDVILSSSDVAEGSNLYFTNARAVTALSGTLADKADLTNITQNISALSITGLTTPIAGSDAVNKTYADTKLSSAGGVSSTDISINGLTVGVGSGAITSNTVAGNGSLVNNTTGALNSAFGYQSLMSNVTGDHNSAFGYHALRVSTASDNSAFGDRALSLNTTGTKNSAFGEMSLMINTTGVDNTAFGYRTLYTNTVGNSNSAFGGLALSGNTGGINNTAAGYRSMIANTTGNNNVASGYYSLSGNTTGSENTAIGNESLKANVSGQYNVATGYFALRANTASANTAFGYYSALANTTGTQVVSVGYRALQANTTGASNTSVGAYSLQFNSTGTRNTANGDSSLYSSTGDNNTATGYNSGRLITTGTNNTVLGYSAGSSITTGSYNVVVGSNTGEGIATLSNNILLSDGQGNLRLQIDSLGDSTFSGTVTASGVMSLSDIRLKKNVKMVENALDRLTSLDGIAYNWDNSFRPKMNLGNKPQLGVIAQQVEKVFPQAVTTDKNGIKTVAYNMLIAPIIESIKDIKRMLLKQNSEIEALKKENVEMKTYLCSDAIKSEKTRPSFCNNLNGKSGL